MAEILIASLPPIGHIGPLLNVAHGLVDRGDRVTFLTSAAHAAEDPRDRRHPPGATGRGGLRQTRLDIDLPGRADTSGIKRVNFDIVRLFVRPMPYQARALAELMAQTRFDAIITDAGFFGILPLLLGDRAARPPVLAYTTTPLMVTSRDTAPSGIGLPPSSTALGRLRNRALNVLAQKVLLRRVAQRRRTACWISMNSRQLPMFMLDSGLLADRYIAPTVPEFDYPRSDLPTNVRYVGAVHPAPSHGFRRPPWWSELDGDRPVVHVTQGTVDNADLGRLLEPTIEALAGEDVIVVVTTGGRDVSSCKVTAAARIPMSPNIIPHDVLLPKVDVMVTNGGYGAVQRALSTGVPLVVAGNTEDKPEVAARVAWTGAGVNLRPAPRAPARSARAVREVLERRPLPASRP